MRTNIPGVFAAGDCTGQPLQIAKAVGEGNIAAISAATWLANRE
jgi:thioredoxin reductase (NADPH)